MPDIGMCSNQSCPSKLKCYRFMAIPNIPRQSYNGYTVEEGKKKCKSFNKILKGDRLNSNLFKCKNVKRIGESCTLNNKCTYPICKN